MNIVTKSDVKKFLHLLKAGLKSGERKELKIYTDTKTLDGTNIPIDHYVSLEFRFRVKDEDLEELIREDSYDDLVDKIIN